MSAFGYGGSYFPSWRGQQQSLNTQSDPLFNIAPEMVRPNFNPVASDPLQNNPLNQIQGAGSTFIPNHYGGDQGYQKWSNPLEGLDQLLNTDRMPGSPSVKQNAIGAKFNGRPTQSANDPYGLKYNSDGSYKPTSNPMELYRRVGDLSQQQMMRLSGNLPGLSSAFNTAAQRLTNAYANPNYQMVVPGGYKTDEMSATLAGHGTDLDRNTSMDYLQRAYTRTLDRMNKNFLL